MLFRSTMSSDPHDNTYRFSARHMIVNWTRRTAWDEPRKPRESVSLAVLKDLYKVIQVMFDTGHYTYKVLPYPFSFRADDVLLGQLGFDEPETQNIFGFLDHVKTTQGMEFEACLEAGSAAMCTRVR